jgi:hypothetical protein
MLIGYQIRNHGADGLQISVDEVKESLRRDIVAEFLKNEDGNDGHGDGDKGVYSSGVDDDRD